MFKCSGQSSKSLINNNNNNIIIIIIIIISIIIIIIIILIIIIVTIISEGKLSVVINIVSFHIWTNYTIWVERLSVNQKFDIQCLVFNNYLYGCLLYLLLLFIINKILLLLFYTL